MYVDDQHNRIELGPQVGGRGGEGSVFEVVGRPQLVAKVFHSPPSVQKLTKIRDQIATDPQTLGNISAWPRSVLRRGGNPVGFLMPFVRGKPVHLLYRPIDRKDHFPTASWQSLVRVCQNIAAGFATLHDHGVLMADVNETNVVITDTGEARFIDCDSFQLRGKNGSIHVCDVGVPMWTPPELQGKDFTRVARTEKHDTFGMAVMLFQVLFMGRHPFAGVPKAPALLEAPPTLEDCIQRGQFAFTRRARIDLNTPPHALTLAALPESLAELFERAFLSTDRPSARSWHAELGKIDFQKCQWGHFFYRRLSECPWCQIWNRGGPNFFIVAGSFQGSISSTDEYLRLLAEIEKTPVPRLEDLSNRLSAISFGTWNVPVRFVNPSTLPAPTPITASKTRPGYFLGWLALIGSVIAFIAIPGGAFFWFIGGIIGFGMLAGGSQNPEYVNEINRRKRTAGELRSALAGKAQEIEIRGTETSRRFYRQKAEFGVELERHRRDALSEFAQRKSGLITLLKTSIANYNDLPNLEKRMAEERKLIAQKEDYLRRFRIRSHKISQIGPARSAVLSQYGIETAWDVKHMGYVPRLAQGADSLKDWVQRLEARFQFRPGAPISESAKQEIRRDLAATERKLVEQCESCRTKWRELLRESHPERLAQLQTTRVSQQRASLEALVIAAAGENAELINQYNSLSSQLVQALADELACAAE
jgi:DNA-binding helix-hairpin-helix protein with protein kinase domain